MMREPLESKRPRCGRRNSRFGCRNCKLRKLKCDETKPSCVRCRAYGVACNFRFNTPDLQPLSEQRGGGEAAFRSAVSSPQTAISNAIWAGHGSTFFALDPQDHDLYIRFRYRTLYAFGGSEVVYIYENHLLKTAFTCPFLLHGCLALTAVHDRYLDETVARRCSWRESHHLSRCTVLFHKWLSQPIKEEHKDALWAAAGILAVLTFSSINDFSLQETWPLRAPRPYDLEWLRFVSGKMKLWHLANPLRPQSLFRAMSLDFARMHRAWPIKGITGVSGDLARLCGLDASSTQESSPYFTVVHGLSRLLEMPIGGDAGAKAVMISARLNDELEAYLHRRDPVALLLLCLWYKKARQLNWWIDFRARYELPAICIYLQRHHGHDRLIQRLMTWDGMSTTSL